MALNTTYTYSTACAAILAAIKSACKNIDAYDASVAAVIRTGGSNTITQVTGNAPYPNVVSSVSNPVTVVTAATVDAQFDSFLANVGINAKSGSLVSVTGLINLFNNVAIFVMSKLYVTVCNQTAPASILAYDSAAAITLTIPAYTEGAIDYVRNQPFTDINKSMTDLMLAVAKLRVINFSSVANCCSCSSSSSSSSSCSCSSCTSSSGFIIYSNLN